MSNLLIGIDKEGKLEENGWREIAEFKQLVMRFGDDSMRTLILSWDSYSVMRRIVDDVERENRVARMYLKGDSKQVLKSKHYIEARYLYQAMNYDVDLDAKQIYTEKLMNINRQISKVDVVESTSKFNELIGIRGKLEQQLNDLNEKLMNRVINKRDLGEMVLSGIEVFYRRAENNKKEDELFRNKRDMARKDARRIAKEKVEAELEGIIRKNKKDELV
jgi:hypothetical protein